MTLSPTSDADLLDAARAGDRSAVEALVTRHAPAVFRFAHRMCDNPADADEVAQDALIAAVRGLPGVRADAAVTTWLFAVTRSFCRKKHRRRVGAPRETLSIDDHDSASPSPEPDEAVAGHELGGAVEMAIRGLDEKQRAVLLLRDVEGLTAPEVAEVLGLEVATVKTRLHRARAAVRAAIEPRLEPAPQASCPEVVTRFSRFLEGDIGPEECERMHAHVEGCPACNAACASLKRSVAVCRAAGDSTPPEVLERVRASLAVVLGQPGNILRRR